MNIWVVTVGEPLPLDGDHVRLHRGGILTSNLLTQGHNVTWWTSTFDHQNKKLRFSNDTFKVISEKFKIILLHGVPYYKNISISRILNHYHIANKFIKQADSEEKPDIIISSLPTLELCAKACEYGKIKKVPVIIDIRDLWPDLFLDFVPSIFRPIAKVFLYSMYKNLKKACRNADAIFGVTQEYINWAIKYSGRNITSLDKDFPFGYIENIPDENESKKAKLFWENYNLGKNSNDFILCFFGAISRQFDLDVIIQVAQKLQNQNNNIKFVLCGDGDKLSYYKQLAKDCDNVIFPGWIGKNEIWELMQIASVGIAPYRNIPNFIMNLPNKPIEYFSSGLPVISSLQGSVLEKILKNNNCGITCESFTADNFIKAINKIYLDPLLLKEMSLNAKKLYKEKYQASKVYETMSKQIVKVCNDFKEKL